MIGANPFWIAGLYLILAGMSRFVEEAFRGEPRTAHFAGLALYQWMALASVVVGMSFLALPGPAQAPLHPPSVWLMVSSLAWGLICAFAMGMDFPESNRRFSRLTG